MDISKYYKAYTNVNTLSNSGILNGTLSGIGGGTITGGGMAKVATGFGAASGVGRIAFLQLEPMRKMLIQDAEAKYKEATDYRDAILLRTPVQSKGVYIVPKGAVLYPIIIGYTSDPSSFEWYLDESKECKENWSQNTIYEVPSKHKFLDSNILPGKAYIVPIDLVLRPIDLFEDRFFFSWYGGFVVGNSK